MFRAWQLMEELRDIFGMHLLSARRTLDDWLACRLNKAMLKEFAEGKLLTRRSSFNAVSAGHGPVHDADLRSTTASH